jgi:class 3 adenylate cyclase
MYPFNSRALTAVPIMTGERLGGAILLEDAAQLAEARDLLPAVASMLAIRMRRPELEETRAVTVETSAAGAQAASMLTPPSEVNFAADLALYGLDTETIGADVFPAVAVMVVRFSDPVAIATRHGTESCSLADRIAEALQEIAEQQNIPYMKFVSQEVVAAAGFDAEDDKAILRIAEAALEAREHCLELFEDCGQQPVFRIGIDHGIAIGSQVGRHPRLFNLWGEAVRTADIMATSAIGAASIQVSEAAYQLLRHQFLFRPRGSFYLPRVGAARTFILASRL